MDATTAQKVIAILNEGVSNELGAIIQYLWHHYMAEGMASPPIIDIFEKASRDEMKHLEAFAERIVALGGEPTTRIPALKKGGSLEQMVRDDLGLEQGAVKMYREHIRQLAALGDTTSRLMVEKTQASEEEHVKTFETLLGLIKKK